MSTRLGRPRPLKRRTQMEPAEKLTVGKYLLKRLAQIGVSHLFLTPEAPLERFEQLITHDPKINVIAHPSCASCGEMADGYGKVKGISCLATTERQGELLDILQRAHEESVPLVLIIGTTQEPRTDDDLFILDEAASYLEKLFRQLTAAWTELSDPKNAAKKIDRALDYCQFFKKPVCIELPQEIVDCYIPKHTYQPIDFDSSDPEVLEEVLFALDRLLAKAKHPLIYIDRDLIAHKAESPLLHFAEKWHIPITSSHLAKTCALEAHSHYLGNFSEELAGRCDLLLVFGSTHEPTTFAGHKARFSGHNLFIDHQRYSNLFLKELLVALCTLEPHKRHRLWQSRQMPDSLRDDILLVGRDPELIDEMSSYFTGDLITSATTTAHYSLAASIGAQLACPHKRAVCFLSEQDLRASLSELYFAHELAHEMPLLLLVAGNAAWVKGLLPDLTVYRRKIPDLPTDEIVIASLQ